MCQHFATDRDRNADCNDCADGNDRAHDTLESRADRKAWITQPRIIYLENDRAAGETHRYRR